MFVPERELRILRYVHHTFEKASFIEKVSALRESNSYIIKGCGFDFLTKGRIYTGEFDFLEIEGPRRFRLGIGGTEKRTTAEFRVEMVGVEAWDCLTLVKNYLEYFNPWEFDEEKNVENVRRIGRRK